MARPKSLVSKHAEKMSRALLEGRQEILRDAVRGRHGVYALYNRGRLCYVGLATNLRVRLKQHLRDRHRESWDQFSVYLTIDDDHLRELESLVVRVASPRGNRQAGRFANSEDLLPLFRRAFRSQSRQKESELFGGPRFAASRATERKSMSRATPKTRELARYVHAPMRLRAKYMRKRFDALALPDGTIRFADKVFDTPSGACRDAIKHSWNGWLFWRWERAPGDWVRLGELRK